MKKLWQLKTISTNQSLNQPQRLPENWGPIFGLNNFKERLGDLSWVGIEDQGWFEVGPELEIELLSKQYSFQVDENIEISPIKIIDGAAPYSFSFKESYDSLKIDQVTGKITGKLLEPTSTNITIDVKDQLGTVKSETIVFQSLPVVVQDKVVEKEPEIILEPEIEVLSFTAKKLKVTAREPVDFVVETKNVKDGSFLFYSIDGTIENFIGMTKFGGIVVFNNTASFSLIPFDVDDEKTFNVSIRKDSCSGNILASSEIISVIPIVQEPLVVEVIKEIPVIEYVNVEVEKIKEENLSANVSNIILEKDEFNHLESIDFCVVTENTSDGFELYYTVKSDNTVQFYENFGAGSFTVFNNKGKISLTPKKISEDKFFTLEVRKDSTSGNVQFESSSIKINKFNDDSSLSIEPTLSPEEITWNKAKELLKESDWAVLPDVPMTKGKRVEWFDYRSYLRNIRDNEKFPDITDWPAPPSS